MRTQLQQRKLMVAFALVVIATAVSMLTIMVSSPLVANKDRTALEPFELPTLQGEADGLSIMDVKRGDGNIAIALSDIDSETLIDSDPILHIDGIAIKGQQGSEDAHTPRFVFPDSAVPAATLRGTVELPRVVRSRVVDIPFTLESGVIGLNREVRLNLELPEVDTGRGVISVSYSPSAVTSAHVRKATIEHEGTVYHSTGAGVTVNSDGTVAHASIRFPIEALQAINDPSSILKVTAVRELVRYEVPFG